MRPTADPDVVDNDAAGRFEIRVDGERAGFVEYRLGQGPITFTHTEIDDRFEGQGLGGRLGRAALEDVRDRGLEVIPVCPFIAGYIDRHPEFQAILAPSFRNRGG